MGKPGASLFLLYTGCVNQWINQLLFISHNTEDILYYRLVFEVDQMEETIMVVINGGLNKRLCLFLTIDFSLGMFVNLLNTL